MRGVLTVESAVWPVFAEVLFERLGSTLPGACAHDHAVTRRLLAGSGFDVEATIAYLRRNGGACDCEVLLKSTPKTIGYRFSCLVRNEQADEYRDDCDHDQKDHPSRRRVFEHDGDASTAGRLA